ncbi:MAG: hypothetical protein Q8Q52_00590 [Acidimicrobiia bacterium]|nr:hypothetical protein [Acidimicrobiia bacterium]
MSDEREPAVGDVFTEDGKQMRVVKIEKRERADGLDVTYMVSEPVDEEDGE